MSTRLTQSHSRRVSAIASGTIASRVTGLLRVLVLAWVFGFSPLADAFNLANTVPNMLFDLAIGGVMSATFIPVFVERLSVDGERRAWRSISSVVTGAVALLVVASIIAWVAAPNIIDGFTLIQHGHTAARSAILLHQKVIATSLLRWFVPQIFFYGLIGIATALLNVRGRFASPSWVPVLNNFVCIGVLIWFHVADPNPLVNSLAGSSQLLWLGLGTTAGVAVQFLALGPSLLRSDLWRLTVRFNPRDTAVKSVARLGSWTLLIVLTNQASLYVILALAFAQGGSGPVSAYTYGWSFIQMPYAVVVVSVLTALTPRFAALATAGDFVGLSERVQFGVRQALVIIIPCTLVMVILAQPLVAILLNHLNSSHQLPAGTVVAVLAAGLPGFTIFQLVIRTLQSMQRTRDAFFLYVVQNGLTIALAFLIGRHSLSGLTGAISISYSATAVVAVGVVRLVGIRVVPGLWSIHVRRSLYAAILATLATAAVYAVPVATRGFGLLLRFGAAGTTGAIVYVVLLVLGERRYRRTHSNSARLSR